MKAYTIHKFWVCQITGEVMAQISFCIGEVVQAYEKFFPTVEFANTYIAKEKREWFLAALEKFINHKEQVIKNGAKDENKSKALQACINAYADFQVKPLETITERFLKGKVYFQTILPNPNNPSHKSSESNLAELIKFCETETKTP